MTTCLLQSYHSSSLLFDQSSTSQEKVIVVGQSMQLVVPSHPLALGSFRIKQELNELVTSLSKK